MGILSIDQHIDWIPFLRLAENCDEQNAEVQLAQQGKAILVRITKLVRAGSEIKVWFSSELLIMLEIPFLQPSNIINHRMYKCINCDQTYSQPNPLKVHLAFECQRKSEQPAKEMFSVSSMLPDLRSSRSSHIDHHFEHARPICMETKEPKTHVCMFCGKLYTRKYGLKIHLRTHTGHKPLQCRYCGRPFSDPSNLNKHIRLHAHTSTTFSNSPYQCRLCSKVLVRKRDLERHIKARHAKRWALYFTYFCRKITVSLLPL